MRLWQRQVGENGDVIISEAAHDTIDWERPTIIVFPGKDEALVTPDPSDNTIIGVRQYNSAVRKLLPTAHQERTQILIMSYDTTEVGATQHLNNYDPHNPHFYDHDAIQFADEILSSPMVNWNNVKLFGYSYGTVFAHQVMNALAREDRPDNLRVIPSDQHLIIVNAAALNYGIPPKLEDNVTMITIAAAQDRDVDKFSHSKGAIPPAFLFNEMKLKDGERVQLHRLGNNQIIINLTIPSDHAGGSSLHVDATRHLLSSYIKTYPDDIEPDVTIASERQAIFGRILDSVVKRFLPISKCI